MTCTSSAGTATAGEYYLGEFTMNSASGDDDPSVPDKDSQTTKLTVKAPFSAVAPAANQTASQTINYANEAPYKIDIVFADTLTETNCPLKIKVGTTEISTRTFTAKTATFTLTKDQVTAQEAAYPVKVFGACGNELDTGISVKISNNGGSTSGAIMATFSKIALLFSFLLF